MYTLDERQRSLVGTSMTITVISMMVLNSIEIIYKLLIKSPILKISIYRFILLILIYTLSLIIINNIKFKKDKYSITSLLFSRDELIDSVRNIACIITFLIMIIVYIIESYYYLLNNYDMNTLLFALANIIIPCIIFAIFNFKNKELNLSIITDRKSNIYNKDKDLKYRLAIYMRDSLLSAIGLTIIDIAFSYTTDSEPVFNMISNDNPIIAIILNFIAFLILVFILDVIYYELKLKLFNKRID